MSSTTRISSVLLSLMLALLPCVNALVAVQAQENSSSTGVGFASAALGSRGVLLQWQSADSNNLGFNIYRLQDGKRSRINGQVVGGAVFLGGKHIAPISDHTYSWIDAAGSTAALYDIESVSLDGTTRLLKTSIPVSGSKSKLNDFVADATVSLTNPPDDRSQTEFAGMIPSQEAPAGPIENQWAVAAQTALKILIKADGWYRVTQDQSVAAGFNPMVDIGNLALYADGREIGMRTSKDTGQFGVGDYFEFYGRALDTPTADTRIYYLIAGTGPGKRLSPEPAAVSTPQNFQPTFPPGLAWSFGSGSGANDGISTTNPAPGVINSKPALSSHDVVPVMELVSPDRSQPTAVVEYKADKIDPAVATSNEAKPVTPSATRETVTAKAPVPVKASKKNKSKRKRRRTKRALRRNHAAASVAAAGNSFQYTVQLKERYKNDATGFSPVYYVSLLNGDTENYFGRVISTAPVPHTLSVSNIEFSDPGPAKLEVAIQGVLGQGFSHQINVEVNGVQVGTLNFGPLQHLVQMIDVPVNQLVNGSNVVTFKKTSTGDIALVDYIRLTYPHKFRADLKARRLSAEINPLKSASLNFQLDSTASASVSGFQGPSVLLLNITDPLDVKLSHPTVTGGASSYTLSVPTDPNSTGVRTLYALQEGRYQTPAGFSLNQPSALNANSGADLVIISYKTLTNSTASLINLRQSQGLTVLQVDIEDVYDEFSYGAHGPQAIKDFLLHAKTHWSKAPKYVIFLGDASLDPRNYEAVGDFDLVPSKLVDATYNETVSDDWLTDFDNDGIGDIPSGRMPVRTLAEASNAFTKIVNFAPGNTSQTALLVADDPTGYYFNFETASDEVGALLPASITLQKVYRRTQPSTCVARTSILDSMSQGVALVNYSGHGNVNVWAGSCNSNPFFQTPDAAGLQNANRLPVVFVSNCLNGYFQDPRLEGIAEGFIKAQGGGAVAVFASSGETIPDGQQEMSRQLYNLLYGAQTTPIGDAVKIAKGATTDIDVRRTWILFGDPSMKIR